MKLDDRTKALIDSVKFMTLATVGPDGDPWSTPLFYAFDRDYTFYWYSRHAADHSVFLSKNNRAAISIYDQNMDEDKTNGFYMKGIVSEVPPDDVEDVARLYVQRSYPGNTEVRNEFVQMTQDFKNESPLRFYKFTPSQIWILGDSQFWNNKWLDYRKEL